jgi:hypothetical protein
MSSDSYTDSDSPELDPSNQNLSRLLRMMRRLRQSGPGDVLSSDSEEESPTDRPERALSQSDSSKKELEQALAMSLEEERKRAERERAEDEELERIIQESIKAESETAEILRFVHDPGQLKSVLKELRGVEPNDPCFVQFFG